MKYAKSKKDEFNIGINYISEMITVLRDFGIPGIHIFTMGRGKATKELLDEVGLY